MPKQKFEDPNKNKPVTRVEKPVEAGAEVSEADQELAEIDKMLTFGKQTETYLKKNRGILTKVGEVAEKILPTNSVRKVWDKLPKDAQMALLYSDLGTNSMITSFGAVPLRFLRKVGMIDYKGDEKEADIDKKTSIQKGIEWLAKHYPETAALAGPLIKMKDGFAELGEDVRSGVKDARRKDRKDREKGAIEVKVADSKRVKEVQARIKKM